MELAEFLLETRADVKEEIAERMSTTGGEYPYEETVFTEIVMEHMASIGMTFEPEACHYERTIGNARLRLGGYAVSEEANQLDLFVSLYQGIETVTPVPDRETKTAAEQCLRFLTRCAEGRLGSTMDQSDDAYGVAHTIHETYSSLDQIRIYVLTDQAGKGEELSLTGGPGQDDQARGDGHRASLAPLVRGQGLAMNSSSTSRRFPAARCPASMCRGRCQTTTTR